MPARDRRRRGRSGVLRLNRGASTFGRSSSLALNTPGGSFMAGRPAGGGVGAAATLLQGLGLPPGLSGMTPGQSQQGASTFNPGPPPMTPSPVAPEPPSSAPHIPTFSPPATTSIASQLPASLFPSFQPILQDPRKRFGF
jgi:hypothetical protein